MADFTTANLGYTEPENGGSVNTWGLKLNENIRKQDVDIFNRVLRGGDVMAGNFGVVAGTESLPGLFFAGDTDTGFNSPAANVIGIATNGINRITISNALTSITNALTVAGAVSLASSLAVAGALNGSSAAFSGNLSVGGNLVVNGTTTTVNSTVVTLDDPVLTLGGDTPPTVDDNKDRGIEFRWHNGTVAKSGYFGFDDSTGRFTFIPDATNTSEVFGGAVGDVEFGQIFASNMNLSGTATINALTSGNAVLTGGSINGMPIGGTTAAAGSFTTLTAAGAVTLNGGTPNAVPYLNASKVLVSGNALTFDGSRLGVNVASPGRQLSVGSATTVSTIQAVNSDTGYAAGDGFIFQAVGLDGVISNQEAGALLFATAGAEGMRLTSTGLGIGTSAPGNKLHVVSSGDVARFTNGTRSAYLALDSAGFSLFTGAGQTGNGVYARESDNSLQLWTNGAAKALLDSAGNLGLVVTPPANTTYPGLFLAQSGYFDYLGNGGLFYNTYTTGVGQLRYRQSGLAATWYNFNQSGGHEWYTAPSGTAGALVTFTRAMALDQNANLILNAGIGAGSRLQISTPGTWFAARSTTAANNYGVFQKTDGSTLGLIGSGAGAAISGGTVNDFVIRADSNLLLAIGNSEFARINSVGSFLFGTTVAAYASGERVSIINASGSNGAGIAIGNTNNVGLGIYNGYTATGTARAIEFQDHNSVVRGSVTVTTAGTSFNTTSDYRLKNLIAQLTDSGARIDALNPIEYEWKSNGKRTRGFFAHEFQQVYADSVTGEKDAVDAEGKPVYQVMQASAPEVIADLVAEIQSIRKRLQLLEAA